MLPDSGDSFVVWADDLSQCTYRCVVLPDVTDPIVLDMT